MSENALRNVKQSNAYGGDEQSGKDGEKKEEEEEEEEEEKKKKENEDNSDSLSSQINGRSGISGIHPLSPDRSNNSTRHMKALDKPDRSFDSCSATLHNDEIPDGGGSGLRSGGTVEGERLEESSGERTVEPRVTAVRSTGQTLSRNASAFSIDSLLQPTGGRDQHRSLPTPDYRSREHPLSQELPRDEANIVAKPSINVALLETKSFSIATGPADERRFPMSAAAASVAAAAVDRLHAAGRRRNERAGGEENAPDNRADDVGFDHRKTRKSNGASTSTDDPKGREVVSCRLEAKELWNKFHELGTEMIITKSGRRMFPVLSVSFSGLVADESYVVATDMVPVDNKRYRYTYHRSAWLVAGRADPQPAASGLHVHPDCPMTGRQLNRHPITFERIKLTNCHSASDKSGQVVLTSMHKYQPRIHLIRRSATAAAAAAASAVTTVTAADDRTGGGVCSAAPVRFQLQSLNPGSYRTFVFPETEFIAVTAYQNQMITKLKIDSNPFAKGFRDSTRLSDIEREGYASSSTLGEFSFLFGTDGGFKDLIPQSPISGDTIPLSLLSHHHHQPQNNPSGGGGGGGGGHALLPGCIGGVRPNARLKSGGDCLSRDAPYFSSSSSSPSSELTSSFNCRSSVFRRMLSLPQSIDYFYSVNNRTTDANKSSNFDDVSGKQMTSQRRRNKFYDLESSLFQSRDQTKETDIFNDSHIINSRRQNAHFVDSMLSTIPPPSSIRHLASRNSASLTPSTASDSFYALRYHPYLATSAILHSNRMPSEVFQM